MGVVQALCNLALQPLIDGACQAVGVPGGVANVTAVTDLLRRHFTDHSQQLEEALRRANARAWKAFEIALAGDSFWDRCKNLLATQSQHAFAHQVRTFLDQQEVREFAGVSADVRQGALRELQAARKAGLLDVRGLRPDDTARQVGAFARFTDPEARVNAEMQTLAGASVTLRAAGYPRLAWLFDLQVQRGTSLLVVAVRFFFRREVEADKELWQGMAWATWQNMGAAQQKGFACLTAALMQHGQRMEELLAGTHRAVLDILEEVKSQKEQIGLIGQAVQQLLAEHRLENRELRPRDSLSIQDQGEREQVKRLLGWYRSLPKEQQARLPALLNGLGMLQHAAGEFSAAQAIFAEVVRATGDVRARAEAHHNAYLAAVERQDWPLALDSLRQALALDPERFQPFRLDKYEPLQILGAGGFGVVFLCRHRLSGGLRVIKALRVDGLGKAVAEQLVHEAKLMEGLKHDSIITLYDCEYADGAGTRLYLAMEYFGGLSLADYVKQHGCLKPRDVVELAGLLAAGLQQAHKRSILHRDVKPDNVLVRRGEAGWEVKIIDFGLALLASAPQESVNTPSPQSRVTISQDIAGTIDYAAPEQMGRLPGVGVGPRSDVYGFGRTCCYALFRTPYPLGKHWRSLTKGMARWLDGCLEEDPKDRLSSFLAVLKGLMRVKLPKKAGSKGQPHPAPVLAAVHGLKVNAVYPLRNGENSVGREKADVDLSGQEPPDRAFVSMRHCTIRVEKGKLSIEDNNSVKGTYLNKALVPPGERRPLKKGDQIQVGSVVLKVSVAQPTPSVPASASQ
jgi:serine/threonine protein kinase